ncbi:anti-repressor SinI family protein [Niallia nealsonii]|uniref:Sin domain-containing protein n=1 Tax=Niallia nealsonii TaxID=115979 RepID=A0A2N0Z2K7_9BACI|nr:anti-repressor SinI family protein [Niallia nealsonii]PKG23740.1 hypothetical protein CWS01_10390 [Niallia nealsonii]
MDSHNASGEHLDQEWIELLLVAREIGLSIKEIRDFLQKKSA